MDNDGFKLTFLKTDKPDKLFFKKKNKETALTTF